MNEIRQQRQQNMGARKAARSEKKQQRVAARTANGMPAKRVARKDLRKAIKSNNATNVRTATAAVRDTGNKQGTALRIKQKKGLYS